MKTKAAFVPTGKLRLVRIGLVTSAVAVALLSPSCVCNDSATHRTAPAAATTPVPEPRFVAGIIEMELRSQAGNPFVSEGRSFALGTHGSDQQISDLNEIFNRHKLVKLKPTFGADELDLLPPSAESNKLEFFFTLQFPEDADLEGIARELNALNQVVVRAAPLPQAKPPMETDPMVGTLDVYEPHGEVLEKQWYLFRCNVPGAWEKVTGKDVVIADIDWGFRTSHQELEARIDHTYNAFDEGTAVDHGEWVAHGTGVVGLASASQNGQGIMGVAPQAAIWTIQANAGPNEQKHENPWAHAILWAVQQNSQETPARRLIILLEVQTATHGNFEASVAVNGAIRAAIKAEAVVVVAAGNGDRDAGLDDLGQPIIETGSILVGATSYDAEQNARWDSSNWGKRIVVSAPGDPNHDVTASAGSDDDYTKDFGGTSGAAPKVAGAVALMLEKNKKLTPTQVREILMEVGPSPVSDETKPIGHFLDAKQAVEAAEQAVSDALPPEPNQIR